MRDEIQRKRHVNEAIEPLARANINIPQRNSRRFYKFIRAKQLGVCLLRLRLKIHVL